MKREQTIAEPDVVLIGGGIMSATLGVLLHRLDPTLSIQIVESLAEVAKESSNPWNNAGTGHAALCELNYTPEGPDAAIDVSKALQINEAFEVSKQLWSHLVEKNILPSPRDFITRVPHMSFVRGEANQDFLRRRHRAMSSHHFFSGIEYTEDPARIAQWAPLLTQGREASEAIAATRAAEGTDVDFGALTKTLVDYLEGREVVKIAMHHQVRDLTRTRDGRWKLTVRNLAKNLNRTITTPFVFVGAGGASLPLLQKSRIPEGKGFGGFPVSGQFLVCNKPSIVQQHQAKVYGRAAGGAPPMSVPHLDTRVIQGKHTLLFGPFAGFSPKFLKSGSIFDLPGSVKLSNLIPLLAVGKNNMDLTRYLIEQVRLKPQERLKALREFFPEADLADWRLQTAGQRVQTIKQDSVKGGQLQFGTEIVAAADGSLAALLGASPGASTAVDIMLNVLEKCFPTRLPLWQNALRSMIPSYGRSLADDPELYRTLHDSTNQILRIAAS